MRYRLQGEHLGCSSLPSVGVLSLTEAFASRGGQPGGSGAAMLRYATGSFPCASPVAQKRASSGCNGRDGSETRRLSFCCCSCLGSVAFISNSLSQACMHAPSRRGGGRSARAEGNPRTPAARPCRPQSSKSSSPPPLYQSSRRHRHRPRFCTLAVTTLRRQRTTQSRASVIASSSSRLCQWRTPCASASRRATGRRVSMRYSGTWMAWSTIST